MTDDVPLTVTAGWLHLVLDVPRSGWGDSIAFWSSVTGWAPTAPRGQPGQFVTLQPSAGDAWLKLQAVDEGARVHLDLDTSDRSTAVERSIELGARPAGRYGEVEAVRSPGGLLFCHRREEPSRRFARADPDSVLDQVCLDVPITLWDQELALDGADRPRARSTGSAKSSRSSATPIRTERYGSSCNAWIPTPGTSGRTPTSRSPTGTSRPHDTSASAPTSSPSWTGGPSCAHSTSTSTASPTVTPPPVESGVDRENLKARRHQRPRPKPVVTTSRCPKDPQADRSVGSFAGCAGLGDEGGGFVENGR